MNAKSPNKHTPGPWHLGLKPGPIIYGPLGEQVALPEITLLPIGEGIANARLIAAAPDLLVAIKDLLAAWPGHPLNDAAVKLHNHARAIIAKAEGESNV